MYDWIVACGVVEELPDGSLEPAGHMAVIVGECRNSDEAVAFGLELIDADLPDGMRRNGLGVQFCVASEDMVEWYKRLGFCFVQL